MSACLAHCACVLLWDVSVPIAHDVCVWTRALAVAPPLAFAPDSRSESQAVHKPLHFLMLPMRALLWVQVTRTGDYGVVRYVGPTTFAVGTWVGIELDNAVGKHDGEVRRSHGASGVGCVCCVHGGRVSGLLARTCVAVYACLVTRGYPPSRRPQ